MDASTIQNRYVGLWSAFTDAAGTLGCRTLDSRGVDVRVVDGRVRALSMFFLVRWPYKVTTKGKVIDVVACISEWFSPDCTRIVESTTNVAYYFRETPGSPDVLNRKLAVHYDFLASVDEAHPIFHMQFGEPRWPPMGLKALGLVSGPVDGSLREIKPDEVVAKQAVESTKTVTKRNSDGYANARVPTAFMGFGQTLLLLAADHLGADGFRYVLDRFAKAHEELPIAWLHNETDRHALPPISEWYDRRYKVVIDKDEDGRKRGRLSALGCSVNGSTTPKILGQICKLKKLEDRQLRVLDVSQDANH